MAAKSIPLLINIRVLEEYFQCSICLNTMKTPMITICGHRYCEKCIKEWVDRHQSCPCCNGPVNHSQLIRDHQFDGLIDICMKEKEKAESQYFENLINTVADPNVHGEQKTVAPVELVLKRHLKSSLAAHELYFEDLRHQFESKAHRLELIMRKQMEKLQLDGLIPNELNRKIQDLERQLAEQKSSMLVDVEQCQILVAEAFDKYLNEHIPSLDILPVKVTVVLADKGIAIPYVTVQPNDMLTIIKTIIEETLLQRGDRVIQWQPNCGKVLLISPVCKQPSYEVKEILEDLSISGDNYPGITLLQWSCKPVLQHHMKPGSELLLIDCVVCESDLPKVCYAVKHKEEGPSPVDYFTCKQCHFKWICRNCIQVCHKDHDVVPLVFNHQPTWACCYCPKKKTCSLQRN